MCVCVCVCAFAHVCGFRFLFSCVLCHCLVVVYIFTSSCFALISCCLGEVSPVSAGSTIDIRALDFRLCSEKGADDNANRQSCGQVFHVMEGGSDVNGFPKQVTPNDDDGYLGLKSFYKSAGSKVTLKLDSVKLRDAQHTFSIWLYIKASQGESVQ